MLWLNIYVLVTILNLSVEATFWNWLITNPHEVNLEQLGFRHDSPLISESGGSSSDNPVLPSHPRDVGKSRHLQSSTISTDSMVESKIRSAEPMDRITCRADDECPQGFYCDLHYALCKSYKVDQDPCRSDSQCAIGYDCMFGRCTKAAPAGHRGSRCSSDRDCLPGLCCARQHGEKICKQKLKLGHSCFVPDGGLSYWLNELCPCEDGLICAISSQKGSRVRTGADWLDVWNDQDMLRCSRPH